MDISLFFRHARGLALLLALGAAVLAPLPANAQAADSWTVTEASDAAVKQNSAPQWAPLTPGDVVASGASLRTGAKGRLVIARSSYKDVITVSSGSEFTLPALANEAAGATVLETIGTLLFKVEHVPGRHFEVKGPYLTAVVKGTVFTVTISRDENVVHLTTGSVEVTDANTKEVALLRPGQTARVAVARGQPMKVLGMLPSNSIEPSSAAAQNGDNEPKITSTLGELHLDVQALSKNLVRSAPSTATASIASIGAESPSTTVATTGNSASTAGGAGSSSTSVGVNGGAAATGAVGGAAGNAASAAGNAAGGTISAVAGGTGAAVGGALGATGTTVGSTLGAVGTTVGSTVGSVGNTVGSTIGTVGTTVGTVGTTVGTVGSTVGSGVGAVGNTVGGTVGSTVSSAGSTVGSTAGVVGSTVGSAASGVTGTLSSLLSNPKSKLK